MQVSLDGCALGIIKSGPEEIMLSVESEGKIQLLTEEYCPGQKYLQFHSLNSSSVLNEAEIKLASCYSPLHLPEIVARQPVL